MIDVINRAKELYQEVVGRGKNKLMKNDESWNVPNEIRYNLNFVKKGYKKSIVQPYYAKTKNDNGLSLFEEDSDVEVAFIEYLEKSKRVKWWFKNGKQDASYFAVPYVENGMDKPFYVDFIVMTTDGKIAASLIRRVVFTPRLPGSELKGLPRTSPSKTKKTRNSSVVS